MRKSLTICLTVIVSFVVVTAQNRNVSSDTNEDLKQWFSQNRAEFDGLRKFSSRSADDTQANETDKNKVGIITPRLKETLKRLRINELSAYHGGDVEISMDEDGNAGYLYSPEHKNRDSVAAPYISSEKIGDDWYLFRKA